MVAHIVSSPGCIQENWPGNLCKFKVIRAFSDRLPT